jgi:hypothetical protein
VTVNGSYPVDRFPTTHASDGAFSAQQVTDAPAGFTNSVKYTVTTADASIGATQILLFRQFIEGNDFADLGWGTANAKTVTLSFWVRSSVTGTFGGSIGNNANDRYYSYSYNISSTDTWEYKTITIVGDTSGTWLTDTGIGARIYFGLTAGADRVQAAGSWQTTAGFIASATGQVQLLETLNATWYITGVQLEEGTVATPFEHRPTSVELSLAQRYYQKSYLQGTVPGTVTRTGCVQLGSYSNTATTMNNGVGFRFPVVMRAAPTMTGYDPDVANTTGQGRWDASGIPTTQGALTFGVVGDAGVGSVLIATTGRTAGAGLTLIFHYTASVEL